MKRKHHEIAGSSDQPNVKRISKLLPYLPGELVRRISEFVVQLTHVRFVRMFPVSEILRHPLTYEIELRENIPPYRLPLCFRFNPVGANGGCVKRTLRFTRFDPTQRVLIFQTLQNAGYQFFRIPLCFIRNLSQIDPGA